MSKHNALVGCCIRVNNIFTVQFPSEYDKIEFENKYTTNKIKKAQWLWFLIDIRSSIRLLKKAQGNGNTHVYHPKNKEVPMIPSLGTNTKEIIWMPIMLRYNQK
jgi:hypothetical protein